MIFDGLNEIFDFFRSSMPYSIIYFLPLFLIVTNPQSMQMVNGAQEFQIYRMLQYDMPFGNHYGSHANLLNMEVRTIFQQQVTSSSSSGPSPVSRRCVLVKLDDFNLERFRQLVQQYVGAIIVILPTNYSQEQKSLIKSFEYVLLREEVKIPVYFIIESEEVLENYNYIERSSSSSTTTDPDHQQQSALKVLIDSIVMNGFQFITNSPQSSPLSQTSAENQAVNIQAKLNGILASSNYQVDRNQKIPTVVITAHYDTFGMATSLSYGCDSNGSGVVALLELSRILSKLYSKSKTVPPLNIIFLLTAQGKFNYHGLKKWLEEQSDTNEAVGKIDLDDVVVSICLDSLGKNLPLYMHVSRPPKEGQASFELLNHFESVANKTDTQFEMIHKKINLANDLLAWEHERFSLNKISAFTLSHFQSHKDSDRSTMTDKLADIDRKILKRNIKIIASALVRFMYKKENIDEYLLVDDLNVSDEFVDSWLEQICTVPRSASLLNKNHPLVNNLFTHFTNYLQESVKYPIKVHSKEPEFVFYNQEQATLIINNVKPAVFDFFLAIFITGYIGLVYLFVLNFGKLTYLLNRTFLLSPAMSSQNGNLKAKSS